MPNFIEELLLTLNDVPNKRSSKPSSVVIGILLFVSMVLFVLEFNWLFSLVSLSKFLLLTSLVGIVIGVILYIALVQLGMSNARWKTFRAILISGVLLTISLLSIIYRDGLPNQTNDNAIVVDSSIVGEAISRIPIAIDSAIFVLRTTIENGEAYRAGDKIPIVRYIGKLGFVIIIDT